MQKTLDESVLSVIEKYLYEPFDGATFYKAVEEALKVGYVDGFGAAVDVAERVKVRVGDEKVDKMFDANRDMVVSSMRRSYESMKSEG